MTKITNLRAFKEAQGFLEMERACGGTYTFAQIYEACVDLKAGTSEEEGYGGQNKLHPEETCKGQKVILDSKENDHR